MDAALLLLLFSEAPLHLSKSLKRHGGMCHAQEVFHCLDTLSASIHMQPLQIPAWRLQKMWNSSTPALAVILSQAAVLPCSNACIRKSGTCISRARSAARRLRELRTSIFAPAAMRAVAASYCPDRMASISGVAPLLWYPSLAGNLGVMLERHPSRSTRLALSRLTPHEHPSILDEHPLVSTLNHKPQTAPCLCAFGLWPLHPKIPIPLN